MTDYTFWNKFDERKALDETEYNHKQLEFQEKVLKFNATQCSNVSEILTHSVRVVEALKSKVSF